MKDEKAVIFTGGKGPSAERIMNLVGKSGIKVAADSGWDLAVKLGITPDLFIGDMDSVKDLAGVENLPENKKLIYPADKDYTDTELAIKYLHTEGYRDIVIIGGGEGRVDHLLAIISLFSRRIKPSEWYTYRERAVFVESEARIECETGQIVSVYPCSDICIASTDGLKWELNDYYMDRTVFSVSNSAVSAGFTIKLKTGTALVIINY